MTLLFFIISSFWFIVIFDKILFWIWLWQLKEYRLDRFRAHFELQSSRGIFANKIYLTKLALFFGGIAIFFIFSEHNLELPLAIVISTFYIGLGFVALTRFLKMRFRMPQPTKKAIFVIGLNIFTILGIAYFLTFLNFILFFAGILAVDIFLVLLVSFWIGFLKFPTDFFKGRIIQKAKEKRAGLKDLLVIGITGSYGKTSVKEILAHILSKKFRVLKTEANQNTEIGVAKAILAKLKPEHQVFVVEMAAYKIGEIKKICEIVQPQIGILTAIGTQHLSLFGLQENIIRGKYELIEALPNRGLVIFNGDNEYCLKLYEETRKPKRLYGINVTRSDLVTLNIFAKDIKVFKEGIEFRVIDGAEEQIFKTKLVGVQNVSNILAAVLGAKELGMNFEEIADAVAEIEPFPHTLEIKKGINDTILIDDSYSANFEGVMAALDYLNLYRGMEMVRESHPKKVMIFYPMIELGKMAKELHRKVGEKIGKVCDLCILTSPDFSKEIIDGAVSSGMDPKNIIIYPHTYFIPEPSVPKSAKQYKVGVEVYEKPISVINRVKSFVKKRDVILVENRVGSEIIKQLTANN